MPSVSIPLRFCSLSRLPSSALISPQIRPAPRLFVIFKCERPQPFLRSSERRTRRSSRYSFARCTLYSLVYASRYRTYLFPTNSTLHIPRSLFVHSVAIPQRRRSNRGPLGEPWDLLSTPSAVHAPSADTGFDYR